MSDQPQSPNQVPKRKTLLEELKKAEAARQRREAEAERAARIKRSTSTHTVVKSPTGPLKPPETTPPAAPEKRQTGTLTSTTSRPQTGSLDAPKTQTGALKPSRTSGQTYAVRGDTKRSAQVMSIPRSRSGPLGWIDKLDQRQKLIVGMCALLAVVVVIGTFLLLNGNTEQQPTYSPTSKPIPPSSAYVALDYLVRMGLNPVKLDQSPQLDAELHASQRVKFDLTRGSEKDKNLETGTFILLGYEDSRWIGGDRILLAHFGKYQDWPKTSFGNLMLLISPDTSASLRSDVLSHLLQLLVAPYRDYLPTATPTPNPTPTATQ